MVSNKEKNFISAVVYVYNNEKNIKQTLTNINNTLKENFNKYEIICVNDSSTDNSLKEIEEFSKILDDEILSVVNMSYYQGLELSMNAGIDLAIGDYVYEFDNIINDYDNSVIMQVYNKCLEGYDIVSTTSENRLNASAPFYKIFNRYSNVDYEIQTETFRILSRRAINRISSMSKNIPYRKAVYANCGLKMYNFVYEPNKKEKVKYNEQAQNSRFETAINSLILFTNIGYKFASVMSAIMIFITVFVAIYTVVIFVSGSPVQGWTTTMGFLSVGFLGIFILLAIVIKYLEILLNLIFKKKSYMIESIDKLN